MKGELFLAIRDYFVASLLVMTGGCCRNDGYYVTNEWEPVSATNEHPTGMWQSLPFPSPTNTVSVFVIAKAVKPPVAISFLSELPIGVN